MSAPATSTIGIVTMRLYGLMTRHRGLVVIGIIVSAAGIVIVLLLASGGDGPPPQTGARDHRHHAAAATSTAPASGAEAGRAANGGTAEDG